MTVVYPLRLFLDCSTAHLSPAARAYVDRTDVVASQSDAGPPWAERTMAKRQGHVRWLAKVSRPNIPDNPSPSRTVP